MSTRVRACLAALLTGCLALLALPADATETQDSFVTLPFSGYGDMLVDAAHGQVFVTGGYGTNGVAVVHLDGSGVTMLGNAPGATRMSMAPDGSHVYVALVNGDGLAEIDTSTLALRRLDTGAGSCPTDVAAVGGYVWFVANGTTCDDWGRIRRLDPATGEVAADVQSLELSEPVLRVPAGTDHLVYAEGGISTARAGVFDVSGGTLDQVASGSLDGFLGQKVQLTGDGNDLMVDRAGSVQYYRLSDFAADGVNSLPSGDWPSAYAADGTVLAAAPGGHAEVDVLPRGADGSLNAIDLGSSGAGEVKGVRLVGDQLFAVTLGTSLRLYQVDRPAVAPPTLTVQVPSKAPAGDPLTVSGTLTDGQTPVAGAVVTLRQDGADQPLGSPTTGADGRYSFTFTPAQPGSLGITAEYLGDGTVKPTTGHAVVEVTLRTVDLALTGPSSVWPDEPVALDGTLFDADSPMPGVDVRIERRCTGTSTWDPVETVTTDTHGGFGSSSTPGPCDSYDYAARYVGDQTHAPAAATTTVTVTWVQPSLSVQAPSSAHVGDQVTVTGTLTTPDGPVTGADLVARVSSPTGWRDLGTVTTDDRGWFSVADTPSVAGSHCYQITYPGSGRNRSVYSGQCTSVIKWSTGMTFSGPDSADLDQAVVLTGRLTTNGAPLAGVELDASRSDDFQGAQTLTGVVTAADGTFTIRDVPPNGGYVVYAVSYPGSASQNPASLNWGVQVPRPDRTLSLRTDRTTYSYGQAARISVGLATDSLRRVDVYAKEAGKVRTLVFSGDVPASGLTLEHSMTLNTTFSASIPEDGRALAASATAGAPTRAGLVTRALGYYRTSSGYKIYHPATDPRFAATLSPARDGACLRFQVQRHYSSGWKGVTTSSCVAVGDGSTATWRLTGRQATRTPYRVRPTFAGDTLNKAANGAWVLFKFM